MKVFFQKYFALVLLMCLFAFSLSAQRSNGIAVEGKISVQQGLVEGAIVQMFMDGRRLDNYGVGVDGRYKVELNYNHKYELIFSLKDNFSQKIVVETAVPKTVLQSDPKFPPFPLDINLFTEIQGIDKSFVDNTVLKIYYNPNVDNFISELYYNDAQIAKLIEQAVLQSKMIGKESDYLSKLTKAELAEMKKEYDELLDQASKEYSKEQFLSALDGFKAASKIFPNEQFPKDRIAEINDLLGLMMVAADLDKALAERFSALIKEADLFLNQKKYAEAKNSYNRALSIKPNDSYANQQIKLINDLLKKKIADEQYENIIAQADNSFKQLLYNEAAKSYQEALGIKPNEAYPKTKLKEISGILANEANNAEKQKSYEQAMQQGEIMLQKQFYEKSLASFENALSIKPADEPATRKVEEVRKIMQNLADKLMYDKLIASADKSYKKDLYKEALNDYVAASQILPDEKYALQRIEEINQKLQLEGNFADLITKADNEFNSKNYNDSKAHYQDALGLRANDKHALDRVKEIDIILAAQGVDEKYNSAITSADDHFKSNDYENAKGKYTEAAGIKPKEKYPKDKILEINTILSQIAKTNQDYQQAIAKADGLFNQKSFEKSKEAFNDAARIKPAETYPPEMIAKIDILIAEQTKLAAEAEAEKVRLAQEAAAAEAARLAAIQAEKDKNYSEAITKADNLFNEKQYENARTEYRTAQTVKPEETYPQQKITEIGTLLAQLSASQKAYEEAVSKADKDFKAEKFESAKLAYNDAQKAKPDETYPAGMIAKIDSTVETRARLAAEAEAEKVRLAQEAAATEAARLAAIQAEKDKNYSEAITKADNLFNEKQYENARTEYRAAQTVKPEETYPQQKISEIGTLLAQLSAAQKAYEDAVSKADKDYKAEKFESAKLAYTDAQKAKPEETYPAEMIAKIDSTVETRARLAAEAEAEKVRLAQEAAAAEAERLAAIQAEKDKNYSEAIAKADNHFNEKQYENARTEYRAAQTVKPEETYPQQKITEIGTLLAQLSASQKAYEDAVSKADKDFKVEKFESAKLAYNDAQKAKPDETYPAEMIAKIDSTVETRARLAAEAEAEKVRLAQEAAAAEAARLAAIQAEEDKNYSEAIAKADNHFNEKQYENARTAYRAAQTVKPGETYPQQRIDEISKVLAELAQAKKDQELTDKNYTTFIQQADRFFAGKSFDQSKGKYNEALVLKPEESYPKERIAEIDKILQQQITDEKYRVIIIAADGFFKTNKYLQAKTEYENALTVKSEEQYPKNQIAKIDDILQKEQQRILAEKQAAEDLQRRSEEIAVLNEELESRGVASDAELKNIYDQYIKQADNLFEFKEFIVSRGWYYKAWDVKPDENYPKQRIDEINRLLGGLMSSQLDRDYQKFIDLADSTFRDNQYAVSRGWYNRALGVKSAEKYPKDQLKEIESKIAERMAAQSGQQFENDVKKASAAFESKNYNVARFWYKKALELRPDDEEVKSRLKEVDEALK